MPTSSVSLFQVLANSSRTYDKLSVSVVAQEAYKLITMLAIVSIPVIASNKHIARLYLLLYRFKTEFFLSNLTSSHSVQSLVEYFIILLLSLQEGTLKNQKVLHNFVHAHIRWPSFLDFRRYITAAWIDQWRTHLPLGVLWIFELSKALNSKHSICSVVKQSNLHGVLQHMISEQRRLEGLCSDRPVIRHHLFCIYFWRVPCEPVTPLETETRF